MDCGFHWPEVWLRIWLAIKPISGDFTIFSPGIRVFRQVASGKKVAEKIALRADFVLKFKLPY